MNCLAKPGKYWKRRVLTTFAPGKEQVLRTRYALRAFGSNCRFPVTCKVKLPLTALVLRLAGPVRLLFRSALRHDLLRSQVARYVRNGPPRGASNSWGLRVRRIISLSGDLTYEQTSNCDRGQQPVKPSCRKPLAAELAGRSGSLRRPCCPQSYKSETSRTLPI